MLLCRLATFVQTCGPAVGFKHRCDKLMLELSIQVAKYMGHDDSSCPSQLTNPQLGINARHFRLYMCIEICPLAAGKLIALHAFKTEGSKHRFATRTGSKTDALRHLSGCQYPMKSAF